jgi:SAM-dependent methyltransferase
VGCGNGRLLDFVRQRWGPGVRYLGIDSSVSLLGLAQRQVAGRDRGRARFQRVDLVDPPLAAQLGEQSFSLITLFGLLHHIPSFDRRRALLQELARCLAKGGILALSCWQFGTAERFRRRVIPWTEYMEKTNLELDLTQLEAGDALLRWGEPFASSTACRYCHFTDPGEVEALLSDLDLIEVDRFVEDGKSRDLNLYVVLEARAET